LHCNTGATPPTIGIAKKFTRKFIWHGHKRTKLIHYPLCPSNFPTCLSFCPGPPWQPGLARGGSVRGVPEPNLVASLGRVPRVGCTRIGIYLGWAIPHNNESQKGL